MKLKLLLLSLLSLLVSITAKAFVVDGIYYDILTNTTVQVSQQPSTLSGIITIPATVTYDNVTYSVTRISNMAFGNCFNITSIEIPNSVTSIGDNAFSTCTGLTSITIPNSVTSIGRNAFGYIPWYNNQPDGLVYAGNVAYKYKGTMPENTNIQLRDGTVGIASEAFYECRNLTNITIPNSVTSIGDNAFSTCTGLTSITIPSSVTNIGSNAFTNTAWYNNQPDGMVYVGNFALTYKGTMPDNTNIQLRDGTVGIADGAFSREYNSSFTKLTSITIPNSVTSIGESTFYNCYGLTSIEIPNSVTSIGSSAFCGCKGLTSIEIPNSVTSIGVYAFNSCTGLTSIEIPNSVTSIGAGAFRGSRGLTAVVSEIEVPFAFGTTAFYDIGSSCTLTVPYGTRDAYIAKGWTSSIFTGGIIEAPAPILIDFADANVKELCVANWDTNGDGDISEAEAAAVTDLGEVFYNTEITSFDEFKYFIGVTSIREWSFAYCAGLTSIELPNSVTTIGSWLFEKCEGLTSLTIPSSVTHIDYLGSLPNLVKITVDKSNPVYDSRNNCNAIIETATNTLITGCIGTIIPKDVTSIGPAAFRGTWSLRSIVIPSNITSIGSEAFAHCFLDELISEIESPFVLGEEVVTYESKLFIPYGTRDAYIAAGWTDEVFTGGIYYYSTLVDDDLETNDVSSYVLLQGLDDREEVPVSIVTDPVNANNHCIAIQSLDNPNHHWDTQFFVKSSRALGKDNRFRLRMKVRAEKEAMSILEAHRSPGDHAFSIGDFNFTTDWVEHTWNGTVSADGIMSIAISMNDLPESAIYYLDDIELIESYPADQSSALEGMLALMNSTNVYTKDAYDTYKAQYDYYKEKYDAGELTETVVNPYKVTGVRSGNDFDDFLLSAWTIGDQQCKDFDTPLIINTWSTEADGKENGSDMHVPFFEYWTADENSLDANTLEATLTDLENGTYTVEALVRVRIKNGASAPAYGITMSVNGGDAVDVCNGKTCGDGDEFLFDTFTATGVVSDGTLRIAFNVADNNNISWLAFKNVKYEKKESNEVAVTDISQLDNAIYIEPVEARCGTQVTLSVKMKNSVAVQTIQFDLYLPDGVSVIANDDGELITASKERIRKYQYFNSSIQPDGALRLLAQATTTNIAAGDGEICMVTVSIPEDMEEGEYPILFKEMRIVGNDNTNHSPSPNLIQTKLVVSSYIPGDANGDGEIDAIDFNIIGNHILGFGQSQFNAKAADINGDGEVDAIDFNMVANFILYGSYGGASASRVFIVEDDIDPS
jgi:hypothetical protein